MRYVCAIMLLSFMWPVTVLAEDALLPRTLISLYNSKVEYSPRTTSVHRFLEMPANRLGFKVRYHDVNNPLPELSEDIAGVVIWFYPGDSAPDIRALLDWMEEAIDADKKLLLIENFGLSDKGRENAEIMARVNRLLARLGMYDSNVWQSLTYNVAISKRNEAIMDFERRIIPLLPPFHHTRVINASATSHLRVYIPESEGGSMHADLVITSKRGGYIAEGLALFQEQEEDDGPLVSQWYVNPFAYLDAIFHTKANPKPDVTTYNGRRIFYSHIDGDGWNNLSEIKKHKQKTSAEVLKVEILQAYPELPFTVGIIAAEVDPECYGLTSSQAIAREMLVLPNVQPASHTYTHPFFWRFFEEYTPEKEAVLQNRYPQSLANRSEPFADIFSGQMFRRNQEEAILLTDMPQRAIGKNDPSEEIVLEKYYTIPRSYYCGAFSIEKEIAGSAQYINNLAPENKQVKLLQWTGDTSPFVEALKEVREASLLNINGGDSRFDNEFPSYAHVAPVGIEIDGERQIYSSNSNENTYTNLWTDRFFGFRFLRRTIENTELPRRILPINVYFHVYSAEKQASLNAVKENLDYVMTLPLFRVLASKYAAIAGGFFTTQFIATGENTWQINNRGELQTIRFDQATLQAVDFQHSKGVLGQRWQQGSLYVTLDPTVENPTIALQEWSDFGRYPASLYPYLIEGSWYIKPLQSNDNLLIVDAGGSGEGVFRWKMPKNGSVNVTVTHANEIYMQETLQTNRNGIAQMAIPALKGKETVRISLVW